MKLSLQRLGDNPKDHDGAFTGLREDLQDVVGVRPDALHYPQVASPELKFDPWTIYPKPPPPHWHWKDRVTVTSDSSSHEEEEFEFDKCLIPGQDKLSFGLDDTGVYQVYTTEGEGNLP